MSKRGSRRRRYHHGDLRRAMLDAALRLVETQGVEALTLRAAARRAGVSPAAPYRHFASKQALLAAVAEEGFRALTDAMRQAAAPHGDEPLVRLRAIGLGYVRFARGHASHFRVMFGRELADRSADPTLREAAGEAFSLLVGAIAGCQAAGLVRPGDPQELGLSAWSMVHGLAALLIDGQIDALEEARAEEVAERATTDLFLGLGPRP